MGADDEGHSDKAVAPDGFDKEENIPGRVTLEIRDRDGDLRYGLECIGEGIIIALRVLSVVDWDDSSVEGGH